VFQRPVAEAEPVALDFRDAHQPRAVREGGFQCVELIRDRLREADGPQLFEIDFHDER
jgi:hypothetical protein